MNLGKWGCGLAAAALLAIVGADAAEPPAGKAAAPSKPSKKAPADNEQAERAGGGESDSLRVRYAQAETALARLNLQIARDRNKAVPNTLPAAQIMALEAQVVLAEKFLQVAEQEGQSDPKQMAVESAQISLKLAEADFARGQEVNRIKRLSPITLERLKLKMEIARMNVERAKAIDTSNPTALLAFELDCMRGELLEVSVGRLGIIDMN